MENLRKEAIRITTLWRKFGPGDARIDLPLAFQEIVLPSASGDKCDIVYNHFDSFEGLMMRVPGERSWKIGINLSVRYAPRRNFTLAHEIGHFIAHRYKQSEFKCTTGNINDFEVLPLEVEANEFAADILMPADEFRTAANNQILAHKTITEISERFAVSRAAAAYRWIALSSRKVGFVVSRDGMICGGRASEKLLKMGVFFRSGDEMPNGESSIPQKLGQVVERVAPLKVWHPRYECQESIYRAEVGDYVYTYLDFGV